MTGEQILAIDNNHIWHPYASFGNEVPVYPVQSAQGVWLTLSDGRRLIDGMASWWSVLHGYNHPHITRAVQQQAETLSHVMFGGLTHEPAARLAEQLVTLAPAGLNKVFFSDSGSVSVDVAMKMAIQYQMARGKPAKKRFLALRNGYHGDTLGSMSVCDPVTGMHHLFSDSISRQFFTEQPRCRWGEPWQEEYLDDIRQQLSDHEGQLAAVILEPVVQGAGGMYFYHPEFVRRVRELCNEHDVLLIADEIATGFGRTGKLFACEHAGISPDILCLGKTLTGGTMTLAATLCSDSVAETICGSDPGVFMHGPTFMGNPLACTAAIASIELLDQYDWQASVTRLEAGLREGLSPCLELQGVENVRALGAIGVVELDKPVNMKTLQPMFVDHGVWIRPFGKLVYMMPPYVTTDEELQQLTTAVTRVLHRYLG